MIRGCGNRYWSREDEDAEKKDPAARTKRVQGWGLHGIWFCRWMVFNLPFPRNSYKILTVSGHTPQRQKFWALVAGCNISLIWLERLPSKKRKDPS